MEEREREREGGRGGRCVVRCGGKSLEHFSFFLDISFK